MGGEAAHLWRYTLRRDDVDAVPVARVAPRLAAGNIDQRLALAEIVFGMDCAALAVQLPWVHVREAGASGLQRPLVARGCQSRFVERPHAAVGPRVGFDIAD